MGWPVGRKVAGVLGAMALAGGIAGAVQARMDAPSGEKAGLSARDTLRLVFRNGAIALPDNASCRNVVSPDIASPTLGDWVASILSHLEPAEGISGITAGCDRVQERLQCQMHVSRRNGEEVWQWGVRFAADDRSHVIDRTSIVCDATG